MKRTILSDLTFLGLIFSSMRGAQATVNSEQQCDGNTVAEGAGDPCVAQKNASETDTSEAEDGESSKYCKLWAFLGECRKNPSYMTKNCPSECEKFDGSNDKDAVDLNEKCPAFAQLGECDVNPRYMREFCIKSCTAYDKKKDGTPMMKPGYNEEQKRLAVEDSEECQLYMAESAIPNSGLGMFTAVPINRGDLVFHPEIVVSYFDSAVHAQRNHLFNKFSSSASWKRIVGNKKDNNNNCPAWANEGECDANPIWMSQNCQKSCALKKSKIMDDFDPEQNWLPDNYYWDTANTDSMYEADVSDSLVPGIGALANSHTGLVNVGMGRPSIDNAGLHRSTDPGVGAFATHYNLDWKASKDIPAGMEIFAGYGDSWFEGREEKFGPLPLSYDFKKADSLMKKFWKNVDEKDSFAQDLLTLTKELPDRANLRMAIPAKLDDAKTQRSSGTAMLSVPNVIRSKEWLQKNGICLDNIRQNQSSIHQAGRGAFATRMIAEGTVIAPLPLIHMDRGRLKTYKENDGKKIVELDGEQLLLNYCYGHKNSSLVLFPYSPVTNFVNHNSDKSAVNAKLQWSTSKTQKGHWFNKTAEEIFAEPYAGLMLEFVALRDIKPNEEIFLDYGDDWDAAWKKHVQEWQPTKKEFPPLYHLNSAREIRTEEEQIDKPYSKDIMTICFVKSDVADSNKPKGWKQYAVDAEDATIGDSHECKILSRTEKVTKETLYEVEVDVKDDDDNASTKVIVNNVPRFAIEFAYRPYASDQHLKTAFRHHISIPDEIFPSKWMNLAK